MRAIIIGAGNAGRNLASKLCQEKHDVILVDHQPGPLTEIETQLDIMTITGHGSSPDILQKAELSKADLLVGVTHSDEVNMLACLQAYRAGVPYKVARISNNDYMVAHSFYNLHDLGIDLAINPREACAEEIFYSIRLPGTLAVVNMQEGKVLAVGLNVKEESQLKGCFLNDFPKPEMLETIRFIAIMRADEMIIPHGETQIQQGDDLYLIGAERNIREFLQWANPGETYIDKVIIAGGGGLGLSLARILEQHNVSTVLIEQDGARAESCATLLDKTLVIKGNTLSRETLEETGLGRTSAFVAATGDDENNIISCLLAQKEGAGYTTAQIADPEYVPIINNLALLNRAVSTHLSTINSILHYIRGKNVKSASILHNLPGELLEVELAQDSKWSGRKIKDIRMPKGSIIATIIREDLVLTTTGEQQLKAGDRLVLFSTPKAVNKLKTICSH